MIVISSVLEEKIKMTMKNNGFELYYIDQELVGSNRHLVIYFNKPNFESNTSLDDCVLLTNEINEYIDEYIDEEYILEVSSAGINRRLYTPEHYKMTINEKIEVLLSKKVEPYEKKRIVGTITEVFEDYFTLDDNKIEYSAVKRANYLDEERND